MSQQPWGQSNGGGAARGLVMGARESRGAAMTSELSQPPQQRRYEPSSRISNPSPDYLRQRIPQEFQRQGPIGVAISRPTRVPQWPLGRIAAAPQDQNINQQHRPPNIRNLQPRPPQRPSNVPSILDASQLQEHIPSFQYVSQRGQTDPNEERDITSQRKEITSPVISSPMTQNSRPSTVSSIGTIPEFPIAVLPTLAGPPKRGGSQGAPRQSRRAASSHYSQTSYVSPIREESPQKQPSHGSYASSAAMPMTWYKLDDEDEYASYAQERRHENEVIDEGRESRESDFDDNDRRELIRNAGLGKKAKPSMIITKSAESIEMQGSAHQQKSKVEGMGLPGVELADTKLGHFLAGERMKEEISRPTGGNPDLPLTGGLRLVEKTTSTSEDEVLWLDNGDVSVPMPSHPRSVNTPGPYNTANSLRPPGTIPLRTPSAGSNRLLNLRRPPRLDIDAVRDAEARGSLTSLTDLIRRATRLASIMDRGGTRPASRLIDLSNFSHDIDMAIDKEMDYGTRRSRLSHMLDAFPPPGLATASRGYTPRPQSFWPVIDTSGIKNDSETPQSKRCCCGLPCWGFLLALLIIVIMIVAAVVVPLEILVIHKPSASRTSATTELETCSHDPATACQNGGTTSISAGSCSCICTNGFTGSICSVPGASGCVTTTLSTDKTYANVTLGDSIPRLITDAQKNFSIPLSGSIILARFSSEDLTCVTENALVTFDGRSQRTGTAGEVVASSPAVSMASAGTSVDFSITEEVLDFARVLVLLVFQQESLNLAISAQTNLQQIFNQRNVAGEAAQNVSIGNGMSANLVDFRVDLGNGSLGIANASMTKRTLSGKRGTQLWPTQA